jgi:hypothetical protein
VKDMTGIKYKEIDNYVNTQNRFKAPKKLTKVKIIHKKRNQAPGYLEDVSLSSNTIKKSKGKKKALTKLKAIP